MGKGSLFVISGPSGVGKGTVISRLFEQGGNLWKSVSATTRAPRKGEREGVDYYFVDRDDFERAAAEGGFLEWAEYSGNLYGTPAPSVREHLDAGEDVILEIEVKGAFQVRASMPEAVLVFIEPPSMAELERRLRLRASEDEDAVCRRMRAAEMELSRKMEYDKQFVNDDIDKTVAELSDFIRRASRRAG